jgi:hypothetical protein
MVSKDIGKSVALEGVQVKLKLLAARRYDANNGIGQGGKPGIAFVWASVLSRPQNKQGG